MTKRDKRAKLRQHSRGELGNTYGSLCYNVSMSSTIQARLDQPSQKALAKLVKRLGWSPSKVVREGLRLLAACHVTGGRRTIHGQGKFASGVGDLSSNKKHMKGFGR